MKFKSTFILLLFYLFHSSIQAQDIQKTRNKPEKGQYVKSGKERISVDSIRMAKVVRVVSPAKITQKQEKSSNQIPQNKVKNQASNIFNDDNSNAVLKEISNSYWRTQEEIKEAKTQNNLSLLEELETNSLEQRAQYIYVFENLETGKTSTEQDNLYHSFKKDF